jgi:hypothetical protein
MKDKAINPSACLNRIFGPVKSSGISQFHNRKTINPRIAIAARAIPINFRAIKNENVVIKN